MQKWRYMDIFVQGSHAFAMFLPTRYVRGGASRAHKRDDLYQLFDKIDCLLALYGSTMHPARLYCGFWTIFFLLSVLVALLHTNYSLSRKKNYWDAGKRLGP